MTGGFSTIYMSRNRVRSWDEPSLTLTCSPAQKQTDRCHPEESRPFTVREYARIQTFPDEWEFAGSVGNQYKQIGNAVPVNLGKAVGESIVKFLEKYKGDKNIKAASISSKKIVNPSLNFLIQSTSPLVAMNCKNASIII